MNKETVKYNDREKIEYLTQEVISGTKEIDIMWREILIGKSNPHDFPKINIARCILNAALQQAETPLETMKIICVKLSEALQQEYDEKLKTAINSASVRIGVSNHE